MGEFPHVKTCGILGCFLSSPCRLRAWWPSPSAKEQARGTYYILCQWRAILAFLHPASDMKEARTHKNLNTRTTEPGVTGHSSEDHCACGGQTHVKTWTVDVLPGVARAGVNGVWAGRFAAAGTPLQRPDWPHGEGFHPRFPKGRRSTAGRAERPPDFDR